MTHKTEVQRLAEEYDMTESKVQRIKKAVRLHYGEEKTHDEIVDEFDNISRRQTVTSYLNEPVADEFKAPYSAKESYELKKRFEERFEELEEKADDLIDEVLERGEYKDRLRAVNELRKINKDAADFAEKIGALDTEPERHEVEHSGVPQVVINTEPEEDEES